MNGGEPPAVEGAPDCPEWLAGEGLAEWWRQIADLGARGLLSSSYRSALALYCQAWGEFVETEQQIRELGPRGLVSITDKGNEIQNPLVGIRNKAFERASKMGAQFGFSPSSKAGIVTEAPKAKDDKSRFFKSG